MTLTVTDDEGSSTTITRNINPQEPVELPTDRQHRKRHLLAAHLLVQLHGLG